MARPRFTRRRFVASALAVTVVGQVPGALLAARLLTPWLGGAAWPAVLALCLLLTAPLALRLRAGVAEPFERGVFGAWLIALFAWWGASVAAALAAPLAWLAARLLHLPPGAAPALALAAGAVAGIGGVSWRRRPRLRRLDVAIDGLPAALDGYRVAHLSDLHMSGFVPPARVRRMVDRINALDPDLVAVTGDLITSGDRFLDDVARELGRLRARDAVALALGNHDYFCDHERLVENLASAGLEVLRNRGRVVARAGASYWLAGVDDTWSGLHDVRRTLAGRPDGVPAIVLAHDPDLFEPLAQRGASLVLSGHTHGGQIAVPIFSRSLNIARLSYRYTAGLYRRGRAVLHVSRGAGTTGPPLRIGSPAEITLLTLRAA